MTFEKDEVLCGVKIGEHSFDNDKMIKEIKERVIARGCRLALGRLLAQATTRRF